jgi:menaquinone-dependent protoporphyrinogen oxidase
MPRILILYGTTDGQTGKIARFLGGEFRALQVEADVVLAAPGSAGPEGYAGVIVAASLHAGGFQRPVRRWVRQHRLALAGRPAMFLAVCLGVLERKAETDAELQRLVSAFAIESGWTPPEVRFMAGALPWSKYGWLKTWVVRRIVARAGGDTDTSRDYEYTDWAELRRMTFGFASACGALPAAPVEAPAAGELRAVPAG